MEESDEYYEDCKDDSRFVILEDDFVELEDAVFDDFAEFLLFFCIDGRRSLHF